MNLPALLRRLLYHPCLACDTPVGRLTAICSACVDRLPVDERWAYLGARDTRLRDFDAYERALTAALDWLATHPRPDAATQTTTTVKEKP